jgi:putative hydrolase of HD superfamily
MIQERLHKQMSFIREIEKLKVVYRQNGTMGNKRQENSAEHSWHIAMMALVLQEYFPHKIDVFRVVKMLLLHDIVEVYAGDTFLYDDKKRLDAKKIEKEAAKKIFSLLPEEQAEDFYTSWLEFEEVAAEALEQIDANGYADRFAESGKQMYKVGVVFSSDGKGMCGWKVK